MPGDDGAFQRADGVLQGSKEVGVGGFCPSAIEPSRLLPIGVGAAGAPRVLLLVPMGQRPSAVGVCAGQQCGDVLLVPRRGCVLIFVLVLILIPVLVLVQPLTCKAQWGAGALPGLALLHRTSPARARPHSSAPQ